MIETTCSTTEVQVIVVDESTEPSVILVTDDTPQVIVSENEPGPQGATGVTRISQADDVDASSATNGSVLVYSTNVEKWVATRTLENQFVDSGHY
jgi:hypothetical protein